ncbi:MAG: hypothetical protein ACM3JI_05035, partial [Anaerolineae bacterium]
ATEVASRSFDVEVDLLCDYRTERTWASFRLKFDNAAGVFGGSFDKLKTDRAYFGTRLLDRDTYIVDAELGRRKLSAMFDSKIEFDAIFDGILLKYDQSFDKIGEFYIHAGTFVINERRDHYGYVGEIGLLEVANTGFYTKYSLIDWDTKDYPKELITKQGTFFNLNKRFDFIVSQWLLGYKFIPDSFPKLINFYLAGLYNPAAQKHKLTDHKRANWGAYGGFSVGQLKKQGDWAFDANYQAVAAQAIPDFDAGGIGLGNAAKTGLYTINIDGTKGSATKDTAGGNTNFRGFQLTLEYLLTNTLNLFQQYQQSVTLDSHIGPYRRYSQYELELIYAF